MSYMCHATKISKPPPFLAVTLCKDMERRGERSSSNLKKKMMMTYNNDNEDTSTEKTSSHPYVHIATLKHGMIGIKLSPSSSNSSYRAKISSLSHLGDPPEGTRSDVASSSSKLLNLHVGDLLLMINNTSLYQIPFSDVQVLSKRIKTECVLAVASERRKRSRSSTTTTTRTTLLKEPKTTKYRITKSYGYMQFDVEEFSIFFQSGSDAPLKSLRADWNRAKYFLNGTREHSIDCWIDSIRGVRARCVRARSARILFEARIRMCTQAIYGHPCHWLHLIYGEDAVVCNGVDAMEVGVVFERVCSRILLEYSSNSTGTF